MEDPIDTASLADVDKIKEEKSSRLGKASVEMVHLDKDTPRTSRRKSLFFETVRYFRKDDIARRLSGVVSSVRICRSFCSVLSDTHDFCIYSEATDNLVPWASYASWSPAFVVFFGPSVEKQHRGMVLVFAGIGPVFGLSWTRRTATDSLSTEDKLVYLFL